MHSPITEWPKIEQPREKDAGVDSQVKLAKCHFPAYLRATDKGTLGKKVAAGAHTAGN